MKSKDVLLWDSLHITYISQHNCYYLSPHSLNVTLAESYCSTICNSNLASIHSLEQQILVEQTLNTRPLGWWGDGGVWIGLSTVDENFDAFTWTDGSPFNYGNNTDPKGTYPWGAGSKTGDHPTNNNCVRVATDGIWLSTNVRATSVLCNDCNGVINKYALIADLDIIEELLQINVENINSIQH